MPTFGTNEPVEGGMDRCRAAYVPCIDHTSGTALHAAVAAERTRLADALHDGALQLLMVARQELDELRAGRPGAVDALGAHLEAATLELRAVTGALHEETLDELPLTLALERVVDGVLSRRGLAVEVAVEGGADAYYDSVLRDAVRQLLENVVRHARASRVGIRVVLTAADLLLVVTDDGVGIERVAVAAARSAGHLGLPRLEHRASALDGSLAVEPGLLGGTVATLRLPRAMLRRHGAAWPAGAGAAADPDRTGQSAQHLPGAAAARDAAAALRDLSALSRDHDSEEREAGAHASPQGGDRSMAAQDRRQAALGRRHARADRNALAAQLLLAVGDRPTG